MERCARSRLYGFLCEKILELRRMGLIHLRLGGGTFPLIFVGKGIVEVRREAISVVLRKEERCLLKGMVLMRLVVYSLVVRVSFHQNQIIHLMQS